MISTDFWNAGYGILLYLDPASGGVLLQVVLGAAASVLVLVKVFWVRLVSLFHVVKPNRESTESDQSIDESD